MEPPPIQILEPSVAWDHSLIAPIHKHFSSVNDSTMLYNKYDVKNAVLLGSGAFGAVYQVRRISDGKSWAMKKVVLDPTVGIELDSLQQEINVQRSLDHANICRVLESFVDTEANTVHLIMELCTGGNVIDRMQRHGLFGEVAVASVLHKVLSAVNYCHDSHVIHRDIKLENIMYENDERRAEPKLIDFGLSAVLEARKETLHGQLGTPSYMAPELWRNEEYDAAVDVWALGVVTFMMLTGGVPFHKNAGAWFKLPAPAKGQRICHMPVQYDDPLWRELSAAAKDFVSKMLEKDPKQRIKVRDAIKHPWIAQYSNINSNSTAAEQIQRNPGILDALQKYAAANTLAKLSLQVIAFNTSASDVQELRRAFQKIDKDGSGTVSLSEFKHALAAQELDDERLEQMFKAIDANSDGTIEYSEFIAASLAATSKVDVDSDLSIMTCFNILDTDGNGTIEDADLQRLFGSEVPDWILSIVPKASSSTSGVVDYDTFKNAMIRALANPDETGNANDLLRAITYRKKQVDKEASGRSPALFTGPRASLVSAELGGDGGGMMPPRASFGQIGDGVPEASLETSGAAREITSLSADSDTPESDTWALLRNVFKLVTPRKGEGS